MSNKILLRVSLTKKAVGIGCPFCVSNQTLPRTDLLRSENSKMTLKLLQRTVLLFTAIQSILLQMKAVCGGTLVSLCLRHLLLKTETLNLSFEFWLSTFSNFFRFFLFVYFEFDFWLLIVSAKFDRFPTCWATERLSSCLYNSWLLRKLRPKAGVSVCRAHAARAIHESNPYRHPLKHIYFSPNAVFTITACYSVSKLTLTTKSP